MRVIVCGGRDYDDGSTVARVLSALDPVRTTPVHYDWCGGDR